MKRFLRKLFARKPHPVRTPGRRPRLALEALEAREVMSASPLTYTTVSEPTYGAANVAGAKSQPLVPIQPMMQTALAGSIASGQVEVVRVHLAQGQALTAESQAQIALWGQTIPQSTGPTITALDATGHTVGGLTSFSDGGLPALAFRAPSAGDYFIQVSGPKSSSLSYQLQLLPGGLSTGAIDKSLLGKSNGLMYTDLRQDAKGQQFLQISGPTGYGFELRGNWVQTASNGSSTYTASGTVYVESPVGEMPFNLLHGNLVVTTDAGPFSQYVGSIKDMKWQVNLGLASLGVALNNDFGLDIGGLKTAGSSLANVSLGVSLGDSAQAEAAGVPLNAAVPYLVVNAGSQVGLTFGDAVVKPGGPTSGVKVSVVIDPADPCFYAHATGLPGPVPELGLGVSEHGLIPFQPDQKPDHWSGQLFGQVYQTAALNLGVLTDEAVPITVSGSTVMNIDASNVDPGAWKTELKDLGAGASDLFRGDFSGARKPSADDVAAAKHLLPHG